MTMSHQKDLGTHLLRLSNLLCSFSSSCALIYEKGRPRRMGCINTRISPKTQMFKQSKLVHPKYLFSETIWSLTKLLQLVLRTFIETAEAKVTDAQARAEQITLDA